MSLKIKLSPLVLITVAGTYTDEGGQAQPFDFKLKCERKGSNEWAEVFKEGEKLSESFARITQGWEGVLDEQGIAVPYSKEALEELFKIPGVPGLAHHSYVMGSGAQAKEKN